MAAKIQVSFHTAVDGPIIGVPGVAGESRDDARSGYFVRCYSVDEATSTYSWSLVYTPRSPGQSGGDAETDGTTSSATLLAPYVANSREAWFQVDWEGSYMVRLVVDAGLGAAEDVQYVRVRAMSTFAGLRYVSAGERRDENGVIPVDALSGGWSDTQNQNVQKLALMLRRVSTSGRVLYVDSNRGRDMSLDQNDPDNLIQIPGTDSANDEETGVKIGARGFADFSSIQDAINYAGDAASRDEPEPDFENPYLIYVAPGVYRENLTLRSHVHISAWNGSTGSSAPLTPGMGIVNIEPDISSGPGVVYNPDPGGLATSDFVSLDRLAIQTSANSTNPLISITGGTGLFASCVMTVSGDDPNQGPVILAETLVEGRSCKVSTIWSNILMQATTADVYAIKVDAPNGYLNVSYGSIGSESGGILFNESNLQGNIPSEGLPRLELVNCHVVARDLGALTYGTWNEFRRCRIQSKDENPDDPCIHITPHGAAPGAKAGDVNILLEWTEISGRIQFDTAGAAGNTSIKWFSSTYGEYILGDEPGDVPGMTEAATRATTVNYDPDYINPENTAAGEVTATDLPAGNVQDALDVLTNLVAPLGAAPFFSLDTAYDGVASLSPFALGSGLGRDIGADVGAVRVNEAEAGPLILAHARRSGGLEVEGIVDIGPFKDGLDDTVAAIGPSEIHLNPDWGDDIGPFVNLGRKSPAADIDTARGFPAAIIQAGASDDVETPGTFSPYNIHIGTVNSRTSPTGELGRIVLRGGDVRYEPGDLAVTAGGIFIEGGNQPMGAEGASGAVWLAPGTDGADAGGTAWLVGASSTGATLQAANDYVGGAAAGNFYLATPQGVYKVPVAAGDALNDVINTINGLNAGIMASSVAPAALLLTYEHGGPNGDIRFLGDDQGDTINTKLGDLAGGTFTAGSYGNKIGLTCSADGELTINGDTVITGSLTVSAVVSSSYIAVSDADFVLTSADPYGIIGMRLVATSRQVTLPNDATDGRKVVIKDENGVAAIGLIITIIVNGGGTIDGAANLVLNSNYAGATLYSAGGNWFII